MGRLSNLPEGRDLAGEAPPPLHPITAPAVPTAAAPTAAAPSATARDGVTLRLVQRSEVHRALQLILGSGGRPATEEQVVDLLRFCVYRGINLNDLWVAEQSGRMAWAILPVVSPGRTMLLFSPTYAPADVRDACAAPLVERVVEHYRSRGVDLAQVLLDPQERDALRVFAACRFETLAELVYLDRDVRRASDKRPPEGFEWVTHSPTMHAQFARAVAATYEGSLDCPRLNGRRDIQDVLAGHQAAGEFDPALWFLLRDPSHAPAGVLLLSRSTRTDALELVYLGLTPAYRGRGLGDLLMRHAHATAARVGSRRLSLAVDSRNLPALALYHRHGMSRICTRMALMRDLRGERPRDDTVARARSLTP